MLIFFNFIRFIEIVPEESIGNSSCQAGHNCSLCSNSELHEEYWCRHGASVFILIRTVQASRREACESCRRTKLPSLKKHYDSEHNIRPSMLTSVPHMTVDALTFRHRSFSMQDRRFATLQRMFFIYLINKYISLSDICLTVHHWYK